MLKSAVNFMTTAYTSKSKRTSSVAKIAENKLNKQEEATEPRAESIFYLENIVSKKNKEKENFRKTEFEAVERNCEKVEAKDKKYIEALKEEMLRKYKAEQEKSQRKIENIKRKALQRIEEKIKQEELKIENMCKAEVCQAVDKVAKEIGWFQTAVLLYKAYPEFFDKRNKN